MKSVTTLFGFLFLFTSLILAQDEVKWNFYLEDKGNGEIDLVAEAKIKKKDGIFMIQIYRTEALHPLNSASIKLLERSLRVNFMPMVSMQR